MNANFIRFAVVVMVFSFSTTIQATEYIYRDLMANTLPTKKCETKDIASTNAAKQYKINIYTKKFCQTQGYGWHVETIKDTGGIVCNQCTDNSGYYQCYREDIVVQCKRIKPGTVGMLPGKG